MIDQPSNDNSTAVSGQPSGPDAHGQAAMLLTESLLHGLIARAVISVDDAIEIVDVTTEIKGEIAVDLGDSRAAMEKSLTLLRAINASFSNDRVGALNGDAPTM